jgi:hypothetical protein
VHGVRVTSGRCERKEAATDGRKGAVRRLMSFVSDGLRGVRDEGI